MNYKMRLKLMNKKDDNSLASKGGEMNNMEERLFTYLQNDNDYKKCNEYIDKILKGDNSVLQEANLFVIQKYDEFCEKDKDLVVGLGIAKVSNMVTNNNLQFSIINGLDSIQKLIIGKFIKIINED